MALLTVQSISGEGVSPTFRAATASGDTFPNDGRTMLHIKNGGTAAVTVTFDSVEKCNFGFDHDLTVSIPASGERIVGPFDPARFNNKVNGLVSVTYSGVTTVTVSALRM